VRCRRLAVIVGLAALVVVEAPAPASAQGIFDALFGGIRRAMTPTRAPSNADPNREAHAGEGVYAGGASSGNCVRLCDGRHFPVNGRGKMSAVEMCRAFCPAAPTQIFSGGGIARAVAPNGQRYSDLPNAFVYRDKLVRDCTCDGKSPTGLVRFEGHDDPTLRPGDIVATGEGLMVYGDGRLAGGYTPITSSPSVSPKLREQLTGTRVAPGRAEELPSETDGEATTIPEATPRPQAAR
jgi:hypothetical protein